MSEINNNEGEKKVILFPGDSFPFDRKLLSYQIFSFNKSKKGEEEKQTLSSMKSVLFYPERAQKLNKDQKSQLIPSIYYGNFYSPKEGDIIIGIISQKSYETYRVNILSSREANLNSIDFQGATRKSKPNLNAGDVIYAKVEKVNKYTNATLTCKGSNNSKDWASGESTYGPLKEGKVYEFNRYLCLKLLENNEFVKRLKECVQGLNLKIGFNGRIWIKTDKIELIPKVFEAIKNGLNLSYDDREILFNNLFNK